ncbi:MAG TPA: hemerythrin domain-containing protein [Candidatus Omnitrophota bacterium]|nr:hemerythrin domain-containing protein [Candidatus Omnitrophota bacterium]
MLVAWNDEHALGYDVIDAGHRLVIDAINRLNQCTGHHADRPVVGEVLQMLDGQLARQFHHEEALMMVSRSRRLEAQRHEHRRMMDTLAHLRASFEAGQQVSSLLLLNLVAFLKSHLRGSDVEEFRDAPVRYAA